MTNKYHLKGLRCPHCGSEGPFGIAVDAVYLVSDDYGVEEQLSANDWNGTSYCECRACGNAQTVRDFEVEESDG